MGSRTRRPRARSSSARTALRGDRLVTNGGRILGVTGTGPTVADARERRTRPASRSGSSGCSTAATSRSTRRRAGLIAEPEARLTE